MDFVVQRQLTVVSHSKKNNLPQFLTSSHKSQLSLGAIQRLVEVHWQYANTYKSSLGSRFGFVMLLLLFNFSPLQ